MSDLPPGALRRQENPDDQGRRPDPLERIRLYRQAVSDF